MIQPGDSALCVDQIKKQAKAELEYELVRAAIDSEKTRIRARMQVSLWARFKAWIPFTITWRKHD